MKEIDSHKLMYHPERVCEWKEKGDCFPVYVEIGLTNTCNHKCKFCALDWIEHGKISIDSSVLMKNLENMSLNGVKSIMYAGEGEPLLHKDVVEIVEKTKRENIDVSITTNGIALTQKKAERILPNLSWIRFSIDAGKAKTYSYLHGTKEEDFEILMRNLEYSVKIKNKNNLETTIGTQALLTKNNQEELVILAKRLKEIGVDNLQIKPYSHHPSSKNDLSFDYSKVEDIRKSLESMADSKFKIIFRVQTMNRLNEKVDYNQCLGIPFFALIDSSGNVLPCNLYYGEKEFFYGNIKDNLFSDIWKGEKRKEVLTKLKQKGVEECRKGCRLDVINRYLQRMKNPHPHDNFI